jgi:cobalt-zinc-cadmium efflux system membrane fusion protein
VSGEAFRQPRWLIVGVVLAALSVAHLLKGCDQEGKDSPGRKSDPVPSSVTVLTMAPEKATEAGIQVMPVSKGLLRIHRDFPGTVQPNENELAEVTTLIRGRVVEVYVDFGQDVKKGTLLALLHSTDLGLAEAAYLKAAAKLHEAELAYERVRDLHQHRAVSLAEVQRREAEMKTARAEFHEALNRLELLGVPRQELERLDREHTIKADVPIRAPFDGRVIMRNITRGEVVETTQKLFTVADLSDVWVVGNVPEKDVRLIHKDQSVEVRTTAYPGKVFTGTITYIGDVLDPATRTMRLRVTVLNPKKRLKPEMFATVRVYASPESEALVVPLSAVQRSAAATYVFVQPDIGRFERRPVVLGEDTEQSVTVLDGLREGELVVTAGAFVLKSEFDKVQMEPAR